MQQMALLKAPSPDGFSASFYLQNWATIHTVVCRAILHFFNTGMMNNVVNKTHVALIPKNL
jgi:hypothetical protein